MTNLRNAAGHLARLSAAAVALGLCATVVPAAALTPTSSPTALPILPRLVGVTGERHPGYDRLVLTFDRPATPPVSATWAPRLYADPSGAVVPVPGRAVLKIVVRGADAHTYAGRPTADLDQAFDLPGLVSLRSGGDFEGVITLGLGTALRTTFRVHALAGTSRVAVDVSTGFETARRPVWFAGGDPDVDVSPVQRFVLRGSAAYGLLDRLFAGTTAAEQADQRGFVASEVTGFSRVTVDADKVARVYLVGPCDTGWWDTWPGDLPGLVRLQDQLIPTLKALPNVDWVKIYDAGGRTGRPTGLVDSVPSCLFP